MRRAATKIAGLSAAAGAFLLAGCTSDHVVGRYASAQCQTGDGMPVPCTVVRPKATASVTSIATPSADTPAGPPSFPERAEAAYIAALAPKSKDAADLRTNLGKPLRDKPDAPFADRRTFHRTIIISLRKTGPFNPADRIDAAEISVGLCHARFDSWDTLATAYTTVSAGTVQLAQTRGLTESLSLGAPSTAPLTASGTVGGAQTDVRTETFAATAQVESLSATIENDGHALVIHRQGGFGIDLDGNIVVKADITFDGSAGDACAAGAAQAPETRYEFSATYKDKAGKWIVPGKLAITGTQVLSPPPGEGIAARTTLTYTLRHITKGDDTYEERDDKVIEITSDPVSSSATLIAAADASPLPFGLMLKDPTAGILDTQILKIAPDGFPKSVGMCFPSYAEARSFLGYLLIMAKKQPKQLSQLHLGFPEPLKPDAPLTSDRIAHLDIVPACN